MTLRGEIVDFGRLNGLNDVDQAACVRHISVMQEQPYIRVVRILEQVIDLAVLNSDVRRRMPWTS